MTQKTQHGKRFEVLEWLLIQAQLEALDNDNMDCLKSLVDLMKFCFLLLASLAVRLISTHIRVVR